MPTSLSQLHQAIAQHFSKDEIKLLCFEIGIDYEWLDYGERGKPTVIAELLRYCQRQRKLAELGQACANARPKVGVDWTEISTTANPDALFRMVGEHRRELDALKTRLDPRTSPDDRKGLLLYSLEPAINNQVAAAFAEHVHGLPNWVVARHAFARQGDPKAMVENLVAQLAAHDPMVQADDSAKRLGLLLGQYKRPHQRNLLLVLEDLHYCPDELWAWLHAHLDKAKLYLNTLVLMTMRMEDMPNPSGALPDQSLAAQVQALLKRGVVSPIKVEAELRLADIEHYIHPAAPEVAQTLYDLCGGSALAAQELWLDWREDGAVARQPAPHGTWVFTPDYADYLLGASAHELAEAEFAQCYAAAQAEAEAGEIDETAFDPIACRTLLGAAALEGETFTPQAVATFFVDPDDPDDTLENGGADLCDFLDDWLGQTRETVQPIVGEDDNFEHPNGRIFTYRFLKPYQRLAWQKMLHKDDLPNYARALRHALEQRYGDARWRILGKLQHLCELAGEAEAANAYANAQRDMRDMDQREYVVNLLRQTQSNPPTRQEQQQLLDALINVARDMNLIPHTHLGRPIVLLDEAANIAAELGLTQAWEMSAIYVYKGVALVNVGDLDQAMLLYRQSLDIKEQLGDLQGKSATLHEMGRVLFTRGDLDAAMTLYRQSLDIKEKLGDLQGKSATLHQMAYVLVTRGDLDAAMALYRQSLDIKEKLGDLKGKSVILPQMANVLVTRGDLDAAMALCRQSLDINEKLGDLKGKSATLHAMANVLVTRGDLDGAMALYRQSLDIHEQLGDLQGKASTLAMLAQIHSSRQEYEQALQALVESINLLVAMGAMPDANKVAEILCDFKQQLGPAAFAALWRQVLGETPQPEWLH